MDINREMPQQPVVAVASLLSLGIVVGWLVSVTLWQLLLVGVVLVAGFWSSHSRWWLSFVLLLYAGFSVTALHRIFEGDISGNGVYVVEVTQPVMDGGRGVASVVCMMHEGDNEWHAATGELRFNEEDSLGLNIGDRVIVGCRVWNFRGRHYANFTEQSVLSRQQSEASKISEWASAVNSWAVSRIQAVGLEAETEAICCAMLLGRREMLSDELVGEYRRSGSAHILALSGFHVMIVYLFVSRMLLLLNITPLGFRIRPLIAAFAVWLYAIVVGMTPSVERAAMMFVMLQLLLFFGRRYDSLSALLIAVTAMMVIDPAVVFDVGFLLSVVAVMAILVWVVPFDWRIKRWCGERFGVFSGVLSNLCSVLFVGFVCSAATLPLVSLTFGYVSPLGVLLNPLIVITAYILLMLSLIWCIVGFATVAPIFGWVMNCAATLQNEAVGYMSSGWRDAVDLRLSLWSVFAIYFLYVILSIIVSQRSVEECDDEK